MADLESDLAKKSQSKQGSFRRKSMESAASPPSMERRNSNKGMSMKGMSPKGQG